MAWLAMMPTGLSSSETWPMVAWISLVAELILDSSLIVNGNRQGILYSKFFHSHVVPSLDSCWQDTLYQSPEPEQPEMFRDVLQHGDP